MGTELLRLPPNWHIFHGLPRGQNADIDHLIIGPGGIFTINTKNHNGARVDVRGDAIFIYGTNQHYVAAVRSEGSDAQSALTRSLPWPVAVHPVVAIVAARVKQREPTSGATVLEHRQVVPWLMSCPTRLLPEQIEFIASTAAKAGTWTNQGPVPSTPYWVADYARKIAAAYYADRAEESKPKSARIARTTVAYPSRKSAMKRRSRRQAELRRSGIAILILVLFGLYAASKTDLFSFSPGGTPKVLGSTGAWCYTTGQTGSDMLTGKAVICASDPAGAATWKLLDPYQRLQIQTPNSGCTTLGLHARTGVGYQVLTCIKDSKTAAHTWTTETRWTPWSTSTPTPK